MTDYPMLIDGALVAGHGTLDVLNPATELPFAKAARSDAAQIGAAVRAAKEAFPTWSRRPIGDRAQVLLAIADVLEREVHELARILTQEQGKPIGHAIHEITSAASVLRYFAGCELPVEVIEDNDRRRIEVHRQPLGVVAAIMPWNFPVAMFASKIGPALLAGNTVVAKPAATTPLATLRIAALVCDIVPAGVLNVVADANDLGGVLAGHPDVRKVSFTGSTATGRKVMASAAEDLKRITLELGGNDAAIVLNDVDPKQVARGLFNAAFVNSGQVCVAVKRVYADEAIYEPLVEELAILARGAVVGDGLEQGTQFGPLQNADQYYRVRELLEDSLAHGTVVAGGNLPDGPGYFIPPTILRDIEDGARIVDEEQFGPILPVVRVRDEAEAVRRANASSYGLGGSVWSSDTARAAAVAAQLETGTAWVNTHMDLGPTIPFGGAKDSGVGVEYGEAGLHEFTQIHVVNIAKTTPKDGAN